MGINERKEREFHRRETGIVAAATDLFRHHDLHAVTIEQIAERAEIGKGTIYKHFQSKDEIYARIVITLNVAMRAEIAQVHPGLPFRQRLARIIDIIWEHDMRDAQFLRRLSHHVMSGSFRQNLGPRLLQEFDAFQNEDSRFYMQLLQAAQERGEIVEGPLEPLLFCTTAAIDGAILHAWQLQAMGVLTPEDGTRLCAAVKDFVYRALRRGQGG